MEDSRALLKTMKQTVNPTGKHSESLFGPLWARDLGAKDLVPGTACLLSEASHLCGFPFYTVAASEPPTVLLGAPTADGLQCTDKVNLRGSLGWRDRSGGRVLVEQAWGPGFEVLEPT